VRLTPGPSPYRRGGNGKGRAVRRRPGPRAGKSEDDGLQARACGYNGTGPTGGTPVATRVPPLRGCKAMATAASPPGPLSHNPLPANARSGLVKEGEDGNGDGTGPTGGTPVATRVLPDGPVG
jgi:hypothetical protein